MSVFDNFTKNEVLFSVLKIFLYLKKTDRQKERHKEGQTDISIERQNYRRTDKEKYRQTEGQTYKQRIERSQRENLCLLLYNHKKQNGYYLLIGAKSMP